MRQYTIFTDDPEEFIALVDSVREEPFYKSASARLVLIASQEEGGPGRPPHPASALRRRDAHQADHHEPFDQRRQIHGWPAPRRWKR